MKRFIYVFSVFLFAVTLVNAGVRDILDQHIIPRYERLHLEAMDLNRQAQKDCRTINLLKPYHKVFDAWVRISHLRFGPVEENGNSLAIAFWPDKKGFVKKVLRNLIADSDKVIESVDEFQEISVAGRGLFALELLLYDKDFAGYGLGDYECGLVTAITQELERITLEIYENWIGNYKLQLLEYGSALSEFNTEREVVRALYTSVTTSLRFNYEQRLGRPLGKTNNPKPMRSEAYRSSRSLINLGYSMSSIYELSYLLFDENNAPLTRAHERFQTYLSTFDEDIFSGITNDYYRDKLKILQWKIKDMEDIINGDLGKKLGVTSGFNSLDGD